MFDSVINTPLYPDGFIVNQKIYLLSLSKQKAYRFKNFRFCNLQNGAISDANNGKLNRFFHEI